MTNQHKLYKPIYSQTVNHESKKFTQILFSNIQITTDIRFFLNLSFASFSLNKLYFCRLEFVQVQTIEYSHNTRNYVFCGKRHPWTILHTKYTVQIQTLVRSPSNYSLLYQVFSSNNLNLFHLCHKDHCTGSYPCEQFSKITSQIYKSIDYLYLSNILVTQKHLRTYIFNVLCAKYAILHVKVTNILKTDFSIYDGPTIESHMVQKGTGSLKLSSFQGTIVVTGINIMAQISSVILNSITLISKTLPNTYNQKLFLHGNDFTSSIVHETIWLVQTNESLSYNLTLDHVTYSGPEEVKNVIHYGGIAVYLIDETYRYKEVLNVNYQISANDNSKRKTIISGLDTTYVVIVYYYYSLYSIVEAELYVSRTECVGYFEPITHCPGTGTVFYPQAKYPVREQKQCLVISVYSFQIPLESVYTRKRDCIRSFGFIMYYKGSSILREMKFESFNFGYKLVILNSDAVSLNSFMGSLPPRIWQGEQKGEVAAEIPDSIQAFNKCNEENTILRKNLKKKLTVGNIPWPVHYQFQTVSGLPGMDSFSLNSSYSHDVWAILSLHFFQCDNRTHSSLFIPNWFFNSNFLQICNGANNLIDQVKKYRNTINYQKEAIYYDDKVSYTGNSSFYGFYVTLNVPNRTDNIRIILDYGFHFFFKMDFIVPVNNFHLVIPTSTIPRCFMQFVRLSKPYKMINFFRLHLNGLKLNEEPFIQLEATGRGKNNIENITFKHMHTKLYSLPKCSDDFGFYKCFFSSISWNEANAICKSWGLELPSVHSTGDIERIIQQIEKKQCKESITSSNNGQHAYHVMHHVFGIYIGLNIKVI